MYTRDSKSICKDSIHFFKAQEAIKPHLEKRVATEQRAYFESILAFELLNHPEWFDSVCKVTDFILKTINKNKTSIIEYLQSNPKVTLDYYSENIFGHFEKSSDYKSATNLINKIITTLTDSSDLSQIMNIHFSFFYHVLAPLKLVAPENDSLSISERKPIFNFNDRGRIETIKHTQPTTAGGIVKYLSDKYLFPKYSLKKDVQSSRAIDRFQPDLNSAYSRYILKHGIPFAGGLSGHTYNLFCLINEINILTQEAFKEYALACFAFLTASGQHSFYEVMRIAEIFDLTEHPESYTNHIPKHIQSSVEFSAWLKDFPDYLELKEDISKSMRPL